MAKIKKEERGKWMNYVGLGILLICYAGALWNVISIRQRERRADVIRLVHWQLELGVRDGLQELIDEFEAYKAAQGHPVEVIQIPIPEQAYNQYVTTQLIGGTAPDMIQTGMFPSEYLGRYFYPLSPVIQQPNPFIAKRLEELRNQETLTEEEEVLKPILEEFANRPWMDMFRDGLRGQFRDDFQEYFGVGFSTFTVRMYYNKDLFHEVLGHDRPPSNFEELLEFSREIHQHGEQSGRRLYPVASSQYQVSQFRHRFLSNLTASLSRDLDTDFSGQASGAQRITAMLRGDFSPWTPEYRAALEAVQQLADFFPQGFMAMGREDSGFSFVQGRAAMITSGSWDALSFLNKIENQPEDMRFDVGIFDLPLITADHPEFGAYVDGRVSEASEGTGFAFGITRHTRNYDLCVEFLQFATTPENNTRLNLAASWIPVVHGAVPGELMRNFEPNYVGYFGAMNFTTQFGGRTQLLEGQLYWPFVSGDIDFETYASRLWSALPLEMATDYKRMYDESREAIPNRQLRRSAFLSDVVLGGQEDERDRVRREINLQRSMEILLTLELTQRTMDIQMERSLAEVPDDPKLQEFNEAFFRALERERRQ